MSRLNNFTQIPHTYTTELPVGPGSVNSLGIKTLKQIININTAFRENYNITSPTNFVIKLAQPLRKVISMKLYDYHLTQDNYSISKHYNNNNFVIIRDISGVQTSHYIDISDGMYTFENILDLENNIKRAIDRHNNLTDIRVFIDPISFKTIIFTDNSLNPFQLDFSYRTSEDNKDCANTAQINNITYRDHLTLGWILGYRGQYIKKIKSVESSNPQYLSSKMSTHYSRCMNTYTKKINDLSFSYLDPSGYSYQSEGLIDLTGKQYMLLSVDDFQNNNNTVFISPFKDQSLLNGNILGKLTDDKQYSTNWPARIYFGPTDIDKLGITIYDPYGRIYNNNYGDYSFELLVETIYDGK